MATICGNYEFWLLEIVFIKLKIRVKIFYEQSFYKLELQFLTAISTNFDGNFQCSVLILIFDITDIKVGWLSGLERLA